MKQRFTRHNGNRRLILIFSGWSVTPELFEDIDLPDHDIMVVWDYHNTDFDASVLAKYTDIYLFAWSFGVFVAGQVLPQLPGNIALKVAVNGSLSPIDDSLGIPRAIFDGTLNNLDERNYGKFSLRMAGSATNFHNFEAKQPKRDISELKAELHAIDNLSRNASHEPTTGWDRVILATQDRIFPLENLKRAWADNPRVRLIDEPHLPNWQKLIEQEIVDKKLIASKFRKSITTYDDNAVAQREIAHHLWKLCLQHIPEPPLSLLEIGYGTGMLTKEYIKTWHPYRLSLWDLVPTEIPLPEAGEIIAGDAEELIRLIPDGYYDAILSSSSIQWFNNLPTFFRHASRVLTPGGYLAISTFGIDNLKEVAEVTHLPLRYFSIAELTSMMPDDCEIIKVEEQHTSLLFPSVRDVMMHLRNTGVNAIRHALTSSSDFTKAYPIGENGATLTYNPIYLLIKKKEQ